MTTGRPFLSIGEVLDLLKVDFPDVTISKIRFLESQGLVDPERTPSGYRKFYDLDVEQLRWILRQQRDHFLPLKVIKDRLERDGEAAFSQPDPPAPEPSEEVTSTDRATATDEGTAPPPAPHDRPGRTPWSGLAERSDTPPPGSQGSQGSRNHGLTSGVSSASFTREELAQASGCDEPAIADLERYGLLDARQVGGMTYYDEESLIVARLAGAFARHGIEARHLRMYKTSAEREAGFYEQVVMPMVKQRNPVARRQSVETLTDLVRLGEGLRGSLLRQALRSYTDNP